MADITCTAFVRERGGAWRDAPIEIVTLNASMLVDHETRRTEDGWGRFPAWHGLVIDGSQCVRFRMPDGRMAAITLVAARCGG